MPSRPLIVSSTRMQVLQRLACAAAIGLSGAAHAQTAVEGAWVRSTVPTQKTTGFYAELTSARGGRLVAASSPVAGRVEIHAMTTDGDVMRMRPVAGLDLPAGARVTLRPGHAGHHLMLLDLNRSLKAGDSVALALVVETADRRRDTVQVVAPVRAAGTVAGAATKASSDPHAGHGPSATPSTKSQHPATPGHAKH